jgi:cytochrome c-type biogenesis protein
MISAAFGALSQALGATFGLALLASLAWGVLSILLSPCHLSSIPLIIGYISTQGAVNARRSFNLSAIFAFGVLVTIALIGVITASLGRLIGDVGRVGNLLVAGVFVIIGLYLMDVLRLNWNGVAMRQTRLRGAAGALTLGLLFGIGLGPCTFAYMAPVLGTVFHLSQTSVVKANSLLLAFGIGHVAVIVGAGSLGNWVQRYLNWSGSSKAMVRVKRVCGALVLLGGVYLIFTTLS